MEAEKVQAAHQWREDFAVRTFFKYIQFIYIGQYCCLHSFGHI